MCSQFYKSCEKYDPKTNNWIAIANQTYQHSDRTGDITTILCQNANKEVTAKEPESS
jgi:hypothetical protein